MPRRLLYAVLLANSGQSSQVLYTLGKGPFQDTLMIVTQPDSDQGQAYGTLRSLFSQTKKIYNVEAFLSADQLKLFDTAYRTTIRKANLATFVSSVFGSTEVGFFHLNEFFLDTFVPEGGRLLKSQGGLFLDLKTQAYISAIEQGERSQEDILNDLFEDNLPSKLLERRGGTKQLTPSESDLVNRVRSRRDHLREVPADSNFLREKYVWIDFLKELIFYVAKNQDAILAPSVSVSTSMLVIASYGVIFSKADTKTSFAPTSIANDSSCVSVTASISNS